MFERLNIFDFKMLVKQRILFANVDKIKHLNMLPTPLSDLFIVNNTRHHFTRHHNDLHIDPGLKENVYRLFSFHGTYIWTHISKNACSKNLSKMFIQANNLPYKII